MLYVNQTKTLSTVVVPLRMNVKKILIEKINMQMPQVSNLNFNYYIKEVVKLAGIDEMIKITHNHGSFGYMKKGAKAAPHQQINNTLRWVNHPYLVVLGSLFNSESVG